MKKKIIIGIVVALAIVILYTVYSFMTTTRHSPADQVVYSKNDFTMTVDYCRPYKKDRLIFGEKSDGALVPFDNYWRTGANDATEIRFNKNVKVEGKPLEKGRYRFYTFPGKDQWTIAFNSELDKWGYSEADYSKDVLRVQVPSNTSGQMTEQFTIQTEEIEDGKVACKLFWDQTQVSFTVEY